jgi:hypothetical protein
MILCQLVILLHLHHLFCPFLLVALSVPKPQCRHQIDKERPHIKCKYKGDGPFQNCGGVVGALEGAASEGDGEEYFEDDEG